MRIDPAEIQKRFAAMDDDSLLDVDRDELSEMAQGIYDKEVNRRRLWAREDGEGSEELDVIQERYGGPADGSGENENELPSWIEDAVEVFSHENYPGSTAAAAVAQAGLVLRAAGIPCFVSVKQPAREGEEASRYNEIVLLVPGPVHLHAVSILDRDLFNATHEEEWQRHFEAISDEDLLALRPEVFTAGLLDRVARMKRVYAEELARRDLKR